MPSMLLSGSLCCYVASIQIFAFQDHFESSLFLKIVRSFVSTQHRTAKSEFFPPIKPWQTQIQQNSWVVLFYYRFEIKYIFHFDIISGVTNFQYHWALVLRFLGLFLIAFLYLNSFLTGGKIVGKNGSCIFTPSMEL